MFGHLRKKEFLTSSESLNTNVVDDLIYKLDHLNLDDNYDCLSEDDSSEIRSNSDCLKEHVSVLPVDEDLSTQDATSSNESVESLDEEKSKDEQNHNEKDKIRIEKRSWTSGHIIEIYDFPKGLKNKDLKKIFSNYLPKGLKLQWVDDTHVLAIFPSSVLANQALNCKLPLVSTRPLAEGIQASKDIVRLMILPEIFTLTTKRLAYKNLGLNLTLTTEELNLENKLIQNIREEKSHCSENRVDNSNDKFSSFKSSAENICESVVNDCVNSGLTKNESSSDKCPTSPCDEKLKTAALKNKNKNRTYKEVKVKKLEVATVNREWNRGSILEIYDFPKELKTEDLQKIFSNYLPKGLILRWVDDTHALAIFPSSVLANEVLSCDLPLVRTRPLNEGIDESKKRANLLVLPNTLRPQTCVVTARRLVYKNLGLNLPEVKESEMEILRKAKEIKMLGPSGREAAWKKRVSVN